VRRKSDVDNVVLLFCGRFVVELVGDLLGRVTEFRRLPRNCDPGGAVSSDGERVGRRSDSFHPLSI
jgi:hypothetical protein